MANGASNKRRRLERGAIVEAAISRAERHGLEELSARKLALDLGCEAMSLYHHVGNMEGLHDAMIDQLLASIPPVLDKRPADVLKGEAKAYLALARTHPRTFRLIAGRRWKGERALAFASRSIAQFAELGHQPAEALARARVLGAYLNGAGLALSAWATDPDQPSMAETRRVATDLEWGLDLLVKQLTGRG